MPRKKPPTPEGWEPLTPAGWPRCQASNKASNNPRNRTKLTAEVRGQCTRRALPGLQVCARHGGQGKHAAAKSARAHKETLLTKAVIRFGARRDIDPAAALLEVVQYAAGDVMWLRERIAELIGQNPDTLDPAADVQALLWAVTRREESGDDVKETSTLEPHPLWSLYEKANDRLVKASAAAVAAGVAERTVALAEQQGLMVAQAIRGVLTAMLTELQQRGLPASLGEQWEGLVGQIVPAHLRALALASGTSE